jgi:hypothetical protein
MKLVCQVARLFREVMPYEPMIDKITVILAGSEFTDQSSIFGIPDRVPHVMKNTITFFRLFKDVFTGPGTQTAQQHVWGLTLWRSGIALEYIGRVYSHDAMGSNPSASPPV